LRQYGRWLRDNYADLEHKEVWQSFVVLASMILVFAVYAFTSEGPIYQFTMQIIILVLVFYLLWRVETLSDLSLSLQPESQPIDLSIPAKRESGVSQKVPTANIGPLLQKYCIDTQLYLQHDLTLSQLAHAIGTNRTYLTKYFIHQGVTYNAYINDLRISHFVNLYREAAATGSPITAQQLAHDSGYRSYSTFSLAFKQRMGQTVTAWMRNPTE
jgi:AraC-like DNA-binding protein